MLRDNFWSGLSALAPMMDHSGSRRSLMCRLGVFGKVRGGVQNRRAVYT